MVKLLSTSKINLEYGIDAQTQAFNKYLTFGDYECWFRYPKQLLKKKACQY